MTSAREVAAHVLARVDKDNAFAAAALEAELGRWVQLDARDRALATELVYGTLRVLPWLMERIDRFAPRGTARLDARVRAHLAIAAYQLYFTRVPAFAAVNEAVGAIRAARGPRVGAFANAVLRKAAGAAASLGDAEREEAALQSVPDWLREALARAISPEGARAFLKPGHETPAVGLRVERAPERADWLARLSAHAAHATHAHFELGRISPLAILARGAGKPELLPGFAEAAWSVQEEGAQLAAIALGAEAGERVLDACAGRGNKTAVIARAVGSAGIVDACDNSKTKLERLGLELGRLGLAAHATYLVDWTAGSGEVRDLYDRVLVDAPCTGVGTLRRRPEIALRRRSPDLDAVARVQTQIALQAAHHVRPGGTLLYVVCSVLREEAEDVVAALCAARPDLAPAAFDPGASDIRRVAGDAPAFRLLPHVHGTDGYFVARLVRARA
jgi:16S rRNA (cytosine967-C5)-methyltransferase